MTDRSIINVLKQLKLFSELSQSELEYICLGGMAKSYLAGETVATCSSLIAVLRGNIAVTKETGGKNLLMKILSAPAISGVASLFSDENDDVSVLTAMCKTEILIIPQEQIISLINSNGEFAQKYIRFLTSRIRYLNDRIRSYTASTSESKLALNLLSLCEADECELILPMSISKLAEMLDISRASMYRGLSFLEENGIISRNNRKIRILDKKKLNELCQIRSAKKR